MPTTGVGRLEGAGLLMAAVLLPLVRQADYRPWDTLWAEDGVVFVRDAGDLPIHETLLRPYAGYGHLLPRLLAAPTRYLPLEWIPGYLALASTLVAAAVAWFVYRASADHVPAVWARLALAAACVSSPVLMDEAETTVANIQWVVSFAVFWALVSRRAGRGDLAARGLVAFLGAATSPLTALYLPLLAAVLWARRRRADAVVGGIFVAGLLVQASVVLGQQAERQSGSSLDHLVVLYPVRVLGSALVGESGVRALWPRPGVWLAVGATAFALVGATLAIRRLGPRSCRTAVAALAVSVAYFALPVYLRGTEGLKLVAGTYNFVGSRYAVVPVLLVVSAAAILCARSGKRWTSTALALQVVVVALLSLGVPDSWQRSGGSSWAEGIRDARASCRTSSRPDAPAPISPDGWVLWMPCHRVVDDR